MNQNGHLSDASTDAETLLFYEQLAQQWWLADGAFWPLHRLNELRIQWIIEQLKMALTLPQEQPLSGLSVLDIGCGGGILSESLAQNGASVTGIDVVEKNIMIARSHQAEQFDINYQLKTVSLLRQEQAQFDVVFNMEVIEHVEQWQAFMEDCHALVKPGGFIFLSTINRHCLALLTAILGAEYILGWLPKGTHQYNKFRKPQELIAMLTKDQFKLRQQTGVGVNPFKKSMFITPNMRVNYMLFAQKNTSTEKNLLT